MVRELFVENQKYGKDENIIISQGELTDEMKVTVLKGLNKSEDYLLKKWEFETHIMMRIINMNTGKYYGLRYDYCVSTAEAKSWACKYIAQQQLIETLIEKVKGGK